MADEKRPGDPDATVTLRGLETELTQKYPDDPWLASLFKDIHDGLVRQGLRKADD
jgi:hypothetical protein